MGAPSKLSGRPRVVFDTNVVLSALLFRSGRLAPLRAAWLHRRCTPLVSRATATELIRALAYPKFRLDRSAQEDLLSEYLPFCETVVIPNPPPATPPCRDPGDVPFLRLAVAGEADCLVTGDADLQAVASGFPVPILAPEAFLARLPP